jgi:hypothetical protein
VLDAARDDQELARLEPDVVAVREAHEQPALEDPEELVRVVVVVPDEVALELRELDLEVVDLRGDRGLQVSSKEASAAARLTLSGMPGAYGAGPARLGARP